MWWLIGEKLCRHRAGHEGFIYVLRDCQPLQPRSGRPELVASRSKFECMPDRRGIPVLLFNDDSRGYTQSYR